MDDEADILSDNSGLRGYIEVLWRRKWVVAIVVLLLASVTAAYSLNQPERYGASAYVRVPPPGGENPLDALDPTSLNVDQQRLLMQDERAVAAGDKVRTAVRKRLGSDARFSVEPIANSTVLKFTGYSESPRAASALANTAAAAYLDVSLETNRESLEAAIKSGDAAAKQMLERVGDLPSGSATRGGLYQAAIGLQQRVAEARTRVSLMTRSGGSLLAMARTPSEPLEPKTARNVAIAATLGLVLGIAAAFVIDRLDDTLRTRRSLEMVSDGRPILGEIPWMTSKRASGSPLVTLREPQSGPTDAFRMVRTSIEILNLSSTRRVIAITSAKQAEGKSLTAANLAVVLGRAGRRVAVVGCDFREPKLHEYFGLQNDVGLTSVLLGETTLENALEAVPGAPNVFVLPAGPTPPNPSEVLSLPAVADVLTALSLRFDYVLVDTPPVLPVPDALQVAARVDGVIVVALLRQTHKRQLRRTLEALDQAQVPVLGTVLGGVERSLTYGYGDDGASNQGGRFSRLFKRRRPAATSEPASGPSTSQPFDGQRPPGVNGDTVPVTEVGAGGSRMPDHS